MVDELFELGLDAEVKEDANFTKEQYDAFWALEKSTWMNSVQKIVDYCYAKYLPYAPDYIGVEADKVGDNEKVALGMALWGFAKYDPETGILKANSGKEFDLKNGNYPVLQDYYDETFAAYEGKIGDFWATENTDGTDALKTVKDAFIAEWGPKDEEMAGKGVPNISGIKKIDDYTVEVKTEGYSAPAVYSILGVNITPLHYYGDVEQYDYENNKFGHPFGDLSPQEANSKQPLGAGPYKFIKYENRVVYYEANESYYKGAPKTKFLQLKETQSSEVAAGVQNGTVDTGELSGTKANFEMVAGYNSNGEINGDVMSLGLVDNLGYGYVGMNADTVKVGEDKTSEESKALRKGLATVIAYYREISYNSYYGEAARVIEYPISNTSWAAPQPTDEGYEIAFSKDAEGNELYSADKSFEENEAAALEGAKSWFKAAGFTFDEATGKFTAAPEGAKLSYEVIIPADGIGDHPSFAVLTYAKEALDKIGIELKINDPSDSNILWNALDAGAQELWCAAWGSTIDPDMYQVYHSSNIVGKGGSDSNHYHIEDPALDQAIMDARKSDDQTYRKATYKQALDIIMDWAVEIPAYQRKNATIFSTQRINMDTMTPDMTTYWLWMTQINEIEMK
ncbi:MAG: ABC transporter substrate-binding protein [Christensenellaceae bacterium]|nr:ABC transporter substrate-binding protein [Christensenellaceae bacterium]